jgi:glycerate-2-kinase
MERDDILGIFQSAITAVHPSKLLANQISVGEDFISIADKKFLKANLPSIYVIGSGKASATMAVEVEKILGDMITDGIVTTKYHHALPSKKNQIREAGHPVPDEAGVNAVTATLELLKKTKSGDIVICLISGGASSLWCDVPAELSLKDIQFTFDKLLKSGADIKEMNTVRKHLSSIKGGQLIRYCNDANVFAFIISDVPGDDPEVIASGPTVANSTTFEDAYSILIKYNLVEALPEGIVTYLQKGMEGLITETPKPNDFIFSKATNKIIGTNRIALEAAAKKAIELGYHTHVVPEIITGSAETEAKKLVEFAIQYRGKKPSCIITGGETTVKVKANGKGGRNQHLALAALKELHDRKNETPNAITILSAGTDGTDGPTEAAGAIVDKEILKRSYQEKLSITDYLSNQDSYSFFQKTNGLIITGPTQTNVMDIMIVLIN